MAGERKLRRVYFTLTRGYPLERCETIQHTLNGLRQQRHQSDTCDSSGIIREAINLHQAYDLSSNFPRLERLFDITSNQGWQVRGTIWDHIRKTTRWVPQGDVEVKDDITLRRGQQNVLIW